MEQEQLNRNLPHTPDAETEISNKLSQGILPSGQDIDRYISNPEMKALKAFYGVE